MSRRSVIRKFSILLLLILAFVTGGLFATFIEQIYESLLLACGVFTATFASIVAVGTKVYFFFFV